MSNVCVFPLLVDFETKLKINSVLLLELEVIFEKERGWLIFNDFLILITFNLRVRNAYFRGQLMSLFCSQVTLFFESQGEDGKLFIFSRIYRFARAFRC